MTQERRENSSQALGTILRILKNSIEYYQDISLKRFNFYKEIKVKKENIELEAIFQLLIEKNAGNYLFPYICCLNREYERVDIGCEYDSVLTGRLIGKNLPQRQEMLDALLDLLKHLSREQVFTILSQTTDLENNVVMLLAITDPETLLKLSQIIKDKLSSDSDNLRRLLTQVNTDGENALIHAACYQPGAVGPLLEMIKTLPQADQVSILKQVSRDGWSKDGWSKDGWNALMYAAYYQTDAVGPLLEMIKTLPQADQVSILKQVSKDGGNALMYAAYYQTDAVGPLLEMIKTLPQADQVSILKKTGDALLYAAGHRPGAVGPLLEIIKTLPQADQVSVLKQADRNGFTALTSAVYHQPSAVRPLLETIKTLPQADQVSILKQTTQGALRVGKGTNALMIAVYDQPRAVSPLLETIKALPQDAQVSILKQVDQHGWTALKYASGYYGYYRPETMNAILKVVEALDIEERVDIIKLSLSSKLIKTLPTSMYLGGFILAIVNAQLRLQSCQFTSSRARYQSKVIKLKDFYRRCRDLKEASGSQEAWSLVFQQAKDDFEQDADILKLIYHYERDVNQQLARAALDKEKEKFKAFAKIVAPSFQIPEGGSIYNACVALFEIKKNYQSFCVFVYYSHKDHLNELFYFLNQLTPADRHQILAEIREEFSKEDDYCDFDKGYANYLRENSFLSLTKVIARPIGTLFLIDEAPQLSAPSIAMMNERVVSIQSLLNQDAELEQHLGRVVFLKDMSIFKQIRDEKARFTRVEHQRFALILRNNPRAQRYFNLIQLGAIVGSINDKIQQESCSRMLYLLIDLFEFYDTLPQNSLDKKLECWSLWQDITEHFMKIVDKKSEAHSVLLSLKQAMQQDKVLGLQQTNRAKVQSSRPVINVTQAAPTTESTDPKRLWNVLATNPAKLVNVEMEELIEKATPEELTCSEGTKNILTLAIQHYPQYLASLVKKMSAQPPEIQEKIAKLCNASHVRLHNFLRLKVFSQNKDAQRALYLLELQRILSGLKSSDREHGTLRKLYEQLSDCNNEAQWVRDIDAAQETLKQQSSVWKSGSLGRIGYGVGLFKPTLGHLLDEMKLVPPVAPDQPAVQ